MYQGIAYVLIAAILWGTGGVSGQYLYENYNVDPVWLVMVRQILAGSVFLCGSRVVLKNNVLGLLKEYPLSVLIFSFLGILGAQLGYYYTISLCNAATATVLQYTAPIMVFLWMAYSTHKRPNLQEAIGVILAFTGVFLISTHGRLDSLAISHEALIIGLISAVSYAIYSIQPLEMLKHYPAPTILGWGQLISGLFLIVFRNPFNAGVNWDIYGIMAFGHLVICATVLTYGLYMAGLKIIGPTKASLFSCAEPLSSIVCVVVLLGTKLTAMDLLGMACIIFTVGMLSFSAKKD